MASNLVREMASKFGSGNGIKIWFGKWHQNLVREMASKFHSGDGIKIPFGKWHQKSVCEMASKFRSRNRAKFGRRTRNIWFTLPMVHYFYSPLWSTLYDPFSLWFTQIYFPFAVWYTFQFYITFLSI